MAFNALYGGEPDERERARVMGIVRRKVSAGNARHLLTAHADAISRLVDIPPGDMRRETWDPRFRAASERCVRKLKDGRSPYPNRLAALAGVLYQVCCNVVHGSKHPDDRRDRMLVRDSLAVLSDLVPLVEVGLTERT